MAPSPKKSPKSAKAKPTANKRGKEEPPPEKPTRKVNMRRIIQLAKPILREDTTKKKNAFRVPYKALRYKASRRVKWLSSPRYMRTKLCNRKPKKNTGLISNVSPQAMKYVATDRIIDLSLPKGFKYV